MQMSEMIRRKRKELGLTQEQVAEYLNVSTPAVSKWETGDTCPDMALLPALARLLKTDPNTLLCFREELSEQEVNSLCMDAAKIIKEEGVEAGLRMMEQKILEYPHCVFMIHQFALVLDGSLVMSTLSAGGKKPYEDKLLTWYGRVAEGDDARLKSRAAFMLASKYMERGEYEKAQEMTDRMEEPIELLDKKLLQADLWFRQKNHLEEAEMLLQRKLLASVMELYGILLRLAKTALELNGPQKAEQIADITGRAVTLLGLGEYYTYITPLEIALAGKDAPECIRLVDALLSSCTCVGHQKDSPLYDRVAASFSSEAAASSILPPLLNALEKSPEYEFLRPEKEFQALIEKYKKN